MKQYLDFALEVKAEETASDGHFKGMAAVFNNMDSGKDIILPGAFTKTLSKGGRNGTGVAMLWQHDQNMPIGIWTKMEEQKKGLYVEGQLAIETSMGKDALILIRMGAVKGLSIGFTPDVFEIDQKNRVRILKEVDLWETSIVTFPMNTRANILGIKAIEGAQTVRQMEEALRDVGLSKSSAKYVAGLCKHALRDAAGEETIPSGSKASGVLEALRSVNEDINKLTRSKG